MATESCACHARFATTDAPPTRIDPGLETTVGPPVGRRFAAVAIAVSVLPLVVSAIALVVKVGSDYAAGSDIGLTELRTLDVGRHPVLLGPYSRDGWNHPGPALFYALALPYRLAGSHSVGLAVGALLMNALAIAGIALVARRVAGLPFMLLTLVGCGVLMRSLGPVFLRNPWNPYIAVLPFGLLVPDLGDDVRGGVGASNRGRRGVLLRPDPRRLRAPRGSALGVGGGLAGCAGRSREA
jgi:hypothetical protein